VKTFQRHIAEQQRQHPTATGEFSWLLSGITLATKIIAAQVRRIGLGDLRGATGGENVQGEIVLKMDRYADDVIVDCLGYRDTVGIMVSEENQEPVITKNIDGLGKYVVLFDPLDGSSNLDCNVGVGTIFAVYGRQPGRAEKQDSLADILQPGDQLLAAGYVLYSSSTVLAYTTGDGVHMFTLDPAIGAYVLSAENVKMPPKSAIISCN
jgi:fructose-1,6-bisphosphatase I